MTTAVRPGDDLAPSDAELAEAAERLEHEPAESIVAWAVERFGDRLCLTASMTDAVLIDVATRVAPGIEVVFLDTGYHFAETLATADTVRRRYPAELVVLSAESPTPELWRTDTDACCAQRKVAPLEQHLAGRSAWLSGLRRVDAPTRGEAPVVERDKRGLVKVNPIATWTDEQVATYVAEHDVPVNPLVARGYPSIGCWPCTRAVAEGEDPRAGRWSGSGKTECGLHL